MVLPITRRDLAEVEIIGPASGRFSSYPVVHSHLPVDDLLISIRGQLTARLQVPAG